MNEEAYNKLKQFEKSLLEQYPLLYKKCSVAEYGPGWYPLIKEISEEIYKLYSKWGTKYTDFPYVVQMKEKFGGLRFYMWSGESQLEEQDSKELDDLVDQYERKSFKVCESCSAPGQNGTTGDDYWYSTLCESCREVKLKKIEERNAAYSGNKK